MPRQREDLPVELQIVADREHARVREQWLERLERVAFGNLIGARTSPRNSAPPPPSPPWRWDERHVAGFIRPDREREAAQLGLHRIADSAVCVLDGDKAGLACALDPGVGAGRGCARSRIALRSNFSLRAAARRAAAECLRRQRTFGLACGRAAGAVGRRHAAPVGTEAPAPRVCPDRAVGPAALAILARRRERASARDLPANRGFGLDLGGIDAGKLGDAPRQPVELHRLEEADEPFVVGLVHGEIADRHVEHHVIVEGDELLRQARGFRVARSASAGASPA